MNADNINDIISSVKILHLLEYQDNKPYEKNGRWYARCPFHESKEEKQGSMRVYPEEKKVHCVWCSEDKAWGMLEYITKLYNFKNGDAYKYLQKYWNEIQPKKEYRIIERTQHKIILAIDDRTYLLTGVKFKKLHDFTMTIKADYKNMLPFFADVNLSNTRSRNDYISNVQSHFSLSEATIEYDANIIMQAVADMQEENIMRLERETQGMKKKFEPTEAETGEAIRILKTKDIVFDELLKDMEAIGFTGDPVVKSVIYLACVSRVLAKPVSILIISGSGGGKSHAIETITSCFPDEQVHDLTGMSPQSLANYDENAIRNHIIITDEIGGVHEEMMYYIRSLLSKGKIVRAVSVQDKATGIFHTIERIVNGPIAYFTTTTSEEAVHDETINRMTVLSIDESIDQNLRIMQSMARRRTRQGVVRDNNRETVFRKYKAIAHCIKAVHPVIPDEWADRLTFNADRLYHKRQFDGYLTMIESLALTRQHQRKHFFVKGSEGKVYECIWITAQDVQDINRLMMNLFDMKHEELKGANATCLEFIKDYCKKTVEGTELKYYEKVFTMLDIHTYSDMPMSTIKKAFHKLTEDQYIVRTFGKYKTRSYFKLNIESDDEQFSGRKLKLWYPK